MSELLRAATSHPLRSASHRLQLAVVVGHGGTRCVAALGIWTMLSRKGVTADIVLTMGFETPPAGRLNSLLRCIVEQRERATAAPLPYLRRGGIAATLTSAA